MNVGKSESMTGKEFSQ